MSNGFSDVCIIPQPTRGELLGMMPLLDFDVPMQPRAMLRSEWKRCGYIVRQRQKPVRKEWHAEAKFYGGQWHPAAVGVYTRSQCIRTEDIEEQRQQEIQRQAEWDRYAGAATRNAVLTRMKPAARRLYAYLRERAFTENSAMILTSRGEMLRACRIKKDDFKGHRDALVSAGLILYQLVTGRRTEVTIVSMLQAKAA